MCKLELYVNGEMGGFHTLIAANGVSREQVGTSQDVDSLMKHAEALLSAKDSPYSAELRVIDPKRIKCKSGDMTIKLSQLRIWNSPSYRGQPDAQTSSHLGSDRSQRLALGFIA